jgi:hypothetical protein
MQIDVVVVVCRFFLLFRLVQKMQSFFPKRKFFSLFFLGTELVEGNSVVVICSEVFFVKLLIWNRHTV